ncbi:YvrJ family protein [Pontibacillus sp. ALD_SL1]|uniref:YvrJ family protein n=1 Tax=Pontibacillus sp. ALD_SL1 TaxID=2777185 RepID=UPI001F60CD6B|nr:YvrJ family protein [Pontibacillus sp. ALD_SL1]
MDYLVFIQLLGNFGFPIAVTMFLLVKFDKKLDKLEEAVYSLPQAQGKAKKKS